MALEHWRPLLIGTEKPVEIYTDHKNLLFFTSKRKLNRRQCRWQEFFSDYNFKIHHVSGTDNVVADVLSRRADYILNKDENESSKTVLLPHSLFVNSILECEPSVESLQNFNDIINPNLSDSEELNILKNPELTNGSTWPVFYLLYLRNKYLPPTLPQKFKNLVKNLASKFKLHRQSLVKKVILNKQVLWVPYLQKSLKMKELHEVMGYISIFTSTLVVASNGS